MLESCLFPVPLFMVHVVGLTPTRAGLTLTPLLLSLTVCSVLSSQLVARTRRYRPLMLLALTVLLLSLTWLVLTLGTRSTAFSVSAGMLALSVGLGLQQPLYTLAVEASRLGAVTSTITFIRQIGSTSGGVIFGTLYAGVLGSATSSEAYTAATVRVYEGGLVLVALALCFTLCLPDVLLQTRQRQDRAV